MRRDQRRQAGNLIRMGLTIDMYAKRAKPLPRVSRATGGNVKMGQE